jgi:deoxycytidylate deaminase
MVHAEAMMCSLVVKDQIKECYTTLFPCVDCMRNLAAHGVKKVVYMDAYEKDKEAFFVAKFYGITVEEYKPNGKEKIQQP